MYLNCPLCGYSVLRAGIVLRGGKTAPRCPRCKARGLESVMFRLARPKGVVPPRGGLLLSWSEGETGD